MEMVIKKNTDIEQRQGLVLPSLITDSGPEAEESFLEFFFATIRNKNTRSAYARAARDFFDWCEPKKLKLESLSPIMVSAYIESHPGSAPTVKQHLAALRMLFDYLVIKRVVLSNPFTIVKGPKHSAREGKTPILSPGQVRALIESIDTSTISGLRDRALIGVMLYTFARVSAVVNITLGDYASIGKRSELRLREKGGKYIVMPAHHNLQAWLDEYIEVAGTVEDTAIPLFCTINSKRELTTRAMDRNDVLRMIKRRARWVGIPPRAVCSHSMRGTGITTFLENDGSLEQAQYMAGHSDPRTTRLYDRRQQRVTQDEVERIAFW